MFCFWEIRQLLNHRSDKYLLGFLSVRSFLSLFHVMNCCFGWKNHIIYCFFLSGTILFPLLKEKTSVLNTVHALVFNQAQIS